MTYSVEGTFYEACDCDIICSCWAGRDPVMGTCTGLFAWAISDGTCEGLDVTGAKVVQLSQGNSCDDAGHMLVLIDAGGKLGAFAALKAAVRSGAWGSVVNLIGTPDVLEVANIAISDAQVSVRFDDGTRSAEVDANFVFDTNVTLHGQAGTLADHATGTLPSVVDVGRVFAKDNIGLNMLAEAQPPNGTPYIFDLDISQVTAMRGAFAYSG